MSSRSTTEVDCEPTVRLSLQERGELEALRFKWIESEKAGHDLGETAVRLWVRRHWHRFIRQKWLEHLHGEAFWVEFDPGSFGVLARTRLLEERPLTATILEHFRWGEENLHILQWALDAEQPMDEIHVILTTLDVNLARVPCRFDPTQTAHARYHRVG